MITRNSGGIVYVATCALLCTWLACDSGGGDDNTGQAGNDAGVETDLAAENDSAAQDPTDLANVEQDGANVGTEPDVVSEPDVGPEKPLVVNGVPAPGSVCPIPEPWGYAVGDTVKNMAFKDCAGNPVTIHDVMCGSSVGWVYFTYGW
ncbi:MAG: hypothetical protein HUU55_05935 [Myxococcales bacterium]|nr:hypothetical protein [Myxococcales bacterium]